MLVPSAGNLSAYSGSELGLVHTAGGAVAGIPETEAARASKTDTVAAELVLGQVLSPKD